jgi:hypothetical protein
MDNDIVHPLVGLNKKRFRKNSYLLFYKLSEWMLLIKTIHYKHQEKLNNENIWTIVICLSKSNEVYD